MQCVKNWIKPLGVIALENEKNGNQDKVKSGRGKVIIKRKKGLKEVDKSKLFTEESINRLLEMILKNYK